MKKLLFVLSVVAILTFGVIGTLVAQGNQPPQPDAPQITLSTAFTYQGVLRRSSGPVTGVCDMAFRLRSLPSGGSAIGSPITTTVPITNGQFIVSLDFGPGAFNGEERYLDIQVRCAPETTFTSLTPRQRISPVPYALALPGLYTLPNATSPNIIGGATSNTISDTVVGGTISGGGLPNNPNRVTGNYGTVAGGGENWVLNAYATIGGGATNRASGFKSTVPGGQSAHATHEGEFAYANGAFAEIGDAQTSLYVLKATTTSALTTTLMKNGSEIGISIAPTRTVAFEVLIAAEGICLIQEVDLFLACSAGYRIEGAIKAYRIGNSEGVRFVGTPVVTVLGEDISDWDVAMIANSVANRLDIRVTGSGNQSYNLMKPARWVATVRTTEVSY